jgi:hypothetical protein
VWEILKTAAVGVSHKTLNQTRTGAAFQAATPTPCGQLNGHPMAAAAPGNRAVATTCRALTWGACEKPVFQKLTPML